MKTIDSESAIRNWKAPVVRAIFSILLAYPLSGLLYSIFIIIQQAVAPLGAAEFRIENLLVFITIWVIMVPGSGGIIPESDFTAYTNMYPWIVPTALILFFCFSKGWRRLKASR